MSDELVIRRRHPRSSPLRSRRIGVALGVPALAGGPAEPFPGLPAGDAGAAREDVVSGTLSALLHAGLLGLLILLAWLTPVIEEELIPVQVIKEKVEAKPEPKEEPAPAPKALAERRAVDFAPQAQALQPQIVNPTVVARAAPVVDAQQLDLKQVAQVAAPKQISAANVVVERASAVQSVVAAQASKVDLGVVAAPALRGPTDATLPSGPSVGPRQVVTTGSTVGTGTAVSLGDTSSVREGIASTRDVLGSPDGAPLASVNTRVGQGFLRGDGGSGSGGVASDCLSRPEVLAYTEQIRTRVYARWVVPPDVPRNQQVKLRFVLEPGGSLTKVEVLQASDRGLGANAMEALRAASPFPPMPERVRCLAAHNLTGTWSVGDYREAGAGGD
jgi:TonB family protein